MSALRSTRCLVAFRILYTQNEGQTVRFGSREFLPVSQERDHGSISVRSDRGAAFRSHNDLIRSSCSGNGPFPSAPSNPVGTDPAARVSAHGGWKAKPTPDLEPGTASSPVMQNRPAGSCRVLEYVPWGGACRANPSRRIRKLRLGPSSQPFSREPRTRLGTLVRSGY
jgi:hypothetical protein